MFGDLFEEDYSSVSNNQYGKGKILKTKALAPPDPREFTNLSGLRNQGGTCYLNSLLQTLHFTPEFREALFSLGPEELGSLEDKDKPDAQVRIIPLQLQRLFAQLLLLDQEAVSTADLTDSFGWTGSEETRQHDVQELNRILFSALETSLVGTSGHDLINRLYHGTIVNQIVCKECQNVSEQQEDFLDLTVAVKNVSGLEDALWNMYVEEELFDSDNLYHCGTCDRLVKATKSAKLRKLPPFLTISLLRFNFDFVKCERYKETSSYTFPLRINLRPFCEQSDSGDVEYVYDLFSVIIHKGGCHGGHYHVYIKDVDHLGNWQAREEKSNPGVNLKDLENEEEIDDPLMVVKAILLQEEGHLVLVDQLGQKLLRKTGTSWNRKYRKQHGPLRKFLELHAQTFLLSADARTVSLLRSGSAGTEPGHQSNGRPTSQALTAGPPGGSDGTSRPHWFDINDSRVRPIEERDIERQFQGEESAYMLFYRKSQLRRPPEARGNPRHRVPCHLLEEVDATNAELQAKREEYESADNSFELRLHLGPRYRFFNGALHPVLPQSESVWGLTFDKRRTLGALRQSVSQLLDFWEGDLVLSVAKSVPAGLHVYRPLDGDDLTLCESAVADGEDIFVWNGVEVGGVQIPTGSDCEPLLLNVLHLPPGGDGESSRQLVEAPRVFPANAEVGAVLAAFALPAGAVFVHNTTSVGDENWAAVPEEGLRRTFREQGLRDGSSVLIQRPGQEEASLLAKQRSWAAGLTEGDWLQVKNLCHFGSAEKQVRVSATAHTVVSDIRIKAIKELKLMKELAEDSCLRPIAGDGKLLCPVPDGCTLQEAGLKLGSSLGLCPGKAPTTSQLFLFFAVGSDVQPGAEMEVIVEETVSVRDCLSAMLEQAGLPGSSWHLRRLDWCYEAGEPLCDEEATLKELMIRSGDTLLLTEGKLLPQGFLKLPIWWYQPRGPPGPWKSRQDQLLCPPSHRGAPGATSTQGAPGAPPVDVPLCYLGDVEISEEATLAELKSQAMTLSAFGDCTGLSPARLRAWTVESKRPSRLLRFDRQPLKRYRLGGKAEICLEPLQEEEALGPHDVLLRTQMRVPGERAYALALDLAWDTARGWTAGSLRQRVAELYSLPVENIEIAKYFPDKSEWLPVSGWRQQQVAKRKKKRQDSLQGAPYYLKDGDTIGVKNLLLEGDGDFGTAGDDVGRARRQLALERKTSQEAPRLQSSDILTAAERAARPRAPEASLSIHVGSFR